MIDKHMHESEFRLRILVTNYCNLSCDYCLNDFQKSKPYEFLCYLKAIKVVNDYLSFSTNPIITISGGEPGLYSPLCALLKKTKKAIVVTNGSIFERNDIETCDRFVCRYNIHIFGMLKTKYPTNKPICCQYVFTRNDNLEGLYQIVESCVKYGYSFKLFENFLVDDLHNQYYDIVGALQNEFGNLVSGRFTGIQENRGAGCNGCMKKCVTLKGVWLFPNGMVSPCPQRTELFKQPSGDYMSQFFIFHNKHEVMPL